MRRLLLIVGAGAAVGGCSYQGHADASPKTTTTDPSQALITECQTQGEQQAADFTANLPPSAKQQYEPQLVAAARDACIDQKLADKQRR